MVKFLNVLFLADSEEDIAPLRDSLDKADLAIASRRVETAEGMNTVLDHQLCDVIISAITLAHFSAAAALAHLQRRSSEVPLIVISGLDTEETALELMDSGAADYVLTDRLERLVPVILRELKGVRVRWQRDQAKSALQQSQEWANLIFNGTTDAMFLLAVEPDQRYRYLTVNNAYLKITGLSADQVLGKYTEDLLPPQSFLYIRGKYAEALRVGHAIQYEITVNLPGGTVIVETTLAPIMDPQGRCTQLLGSSHEITQRKQSEQDLRQSEEKFAKAFHISPDAMNINRLEDGHYLDVNQGFLDLTGYTKAEVLGKTSLELNIWVNPEDRQRLVQELQEKGQVVNLEAPFRGKNGVIKTCLMSASLLEIHHEKCILSVTHDITERKHAEEALAKSAALLQDTQKLSRVGGWEWHVADQSMTWSDETYRIHGFSPGEVLPGSPEHIQRSLVCYTPEDRGIIATAFEACAAQGTPYEMEFPFTSVVGEKKWIRTMAKAEWQAGKVVRVTGNIMDITGQKLAEIALAESLEKLELLFDVLPVGISVLDQDHKLVKSNPALSAILRISDVGLARGDYRHRSYFRVDGSRMPAAEFASSRVFRGENSAYHVETGVEIEDGSLVWTDVSAAACGFPDWRTVIVTSDITRRITTEKKNQQLLEQLRQQNDEQEKIIRLTTHLRQALTSDAAQAILVEQAIEIFSVDAAALLLISDDTFQIGACSQKWLPWLGASHPQGENTFKEILHSTHPYWIHSPEDFRKIFPFPHLDANPMTDLFSCALVPVHSGDAPVGLLVLGNYSGKNLLESQANLLATVAEITGITIQRMKTMEATEQLASRRTKELSALYNVISTASHSKVLKDRLDMALGEVLRSLNSSFGGIFLYDRDRNRLISIACQMLPAGVVEIIENAPLENTWEGWVIAHQEALIISDVSTDQRFIDTQQRTKDQKQVYIGMPIKHQESVMGVLSMVRVGTQVFSIDEITFTAALADHIGVIIENNKLIERAEKAALVEERSRLARELHDSVTQTLYSSAFFAETGLKMIAQGKLEQAKESLTQLSKISQQALKEMRLLIYQLRPETLKQEGLVPALRQRLELVENKLSLQTHLIVNEIRRMSSPVEDALYWTAIEALNNIVKHAQASQIMVQIQIEKERVLLQIQDNGKGFDPLANTPLMGLGLHNIRERLRKVGGALEISSAKGKGTLLTAICPLEE